MKCVGVDPGLADTGVAVVSGHDMIIENYAFGGIRTSKKMSLPERLAVIYRHVSDVFKTEQPDLIVMEDVFSLEKYPKSGILLGKVMGVVSLASWNAGIRMIEVPVREAKKVLSGNGNASKSQLELSVRHLLNHPAPIRPDHASDALALAIIGLFRYAEMMKE